jgi:hypothetical protein
LALDEDVSVFIAESHATCAAVALVVARVRVGELEGSHRSGEEEKVKEIL